MAATVYQYPKCGTCRKAMNWMMERSVDYKTIDIVSDPPTAEQLRDFWKRSGLPIRKLFNTSGMSYRQGNWKTRLDTVTDDEAIEALAADGKLIKRPIVVTGSAVLVGFKEPDYQSAFSG